MDMGSIPWRGAKFKTMETNEIKKELYKHNPIAYLKMIRKGVAYYEAMLHNVTEIRFEVPVSDMGDADFLFQMDSKLLIRYIA